MLTIKSAAAMALAMASPLDQQIKQLLSERSDQLLADTGSEYDVGELATWVIVDQGDILASIEAEVGFPLIADPPWEWVLDHGGIFEAPIIVSDDGFGVILIVPDREEVDRHLLSLLRAQATFANTPKT